ncbi:MAG: hypothetical protein QM498_06095, partial [Desulfobacterium sp.]
LSYCFFCILAIYRYHMSFIRDTPVFNNQNLETAIKNGLILPAVAQRQYEPKQDCSHLGFCRGQWNCLDCLIKLSTHMFFSIPWQVLNKFGYSVTHFEYQPAFKGLNELYLPR